jgi:hypothetical protein
MKVDILTEKSSTSEGIQEFYLGGKISFSREKFIIFAENLKLKFGGKFKIKIWREKVNQTEENLAGKIRYGSLSVE